MFREETEKRTVAREDPESVSAVRNACKLCAPLGASLVFKGIRGCMPMIHGSQGCATYIRRYLISHYKEPVDIASSNFSEESTVFGGSNNFCAGIDNIIRQYHPEVIGIASSCLSETIGEDITGLIHSYRARNNNKNLPHFITVSTPSYKGTHMDGFHETVLATVQSAARSNFKGNHLNVFPGFVSPADLRHIKTILNGFGMKYVMLPDYSETLDGGFWKEYQLIPGGGTPISELTYAGSARASIEMGAVMHAGITAGGWLSEKHGVENHSFPMPIGINNSDAFFKCLETLSGKEMPATFKLQRSRLIDAYVDGHKYTFDKRAVVYGEEDFVLAMVTFLCEIGIRPVLAGSGAGGNRLEQAIRKYSKTESADMKVIQGLDFATLSELAKGLKPDIIIGHSKGYDVARRLKIPLIRSGFPVHDRIGGQRLQHIGYEGTLQLFDRIVNALIEYKQDNSPVGYKYI
jgi:nitrogenase molybdenum-iron protein NifN